MKSVTAAAREYLRRGWKPVPFARGEKGPSGPKAAKWQDRVVTEENIDKLFSNDHNIGLQMGPKSGGLTDVDLDSVEAVGLADYFLPPTKSEFGRKSKPRSHRLYIVTDVPPDLPSTIQYKDEKGTMIVEIRLGVSAGAQSMCPPSIHPGGEDVEWQVDEEPACIPYAILLRAVQLLAAASLIHWPADQSNRHVLAMKVGGFLKRANLTDDEIEQVIAAVATEAGDEEIKDRIRGAADADMYGFPAVAEEFGIEVAKTLTKILGYSHFEETEIAKINEGYAFVITGGKAGIMRFDGKKFDLLQIPAFKGWFANKVKIFVDDKYVSVATVWLGHKDRREYSGIEFSPPGTLLRPGNYNLWQGFAVEPKEGDCSKFLAHILDNVAQGDRDLFNWILCWFGDIFQNPSIKQGTSLVFRGEQGVGKTIVGQIIGSLIGDAHYMLVSNPRYITGQFNAHMKSLLLLHADEAFWAGDKKGEGTLKDIVTGLTFTIEFKFFDPIVLKNYLRLFSTGNADWLVPAGFDERRFCVLDVGRDHIQDIPYFAAILEEMRNGGREALLHHLLTLDLAQVNLRKIPKTSALLEQKIASATPEEAWWLDVLKEGTLPPIVKYENEKEGIKNSCFSSDLYEGYISHARKQGVSRRAIETKLGMFLTKVVGPKLEKKQMKRKDRKPDWYYEFPPLKDCRDWFAKMVHQDMAWDGEEEWSNTINWPSQPF